MTKKQSQSALPGCGIVIVGCLLMVIVLGPLTVLGCNWLSARLSIQPPSVAGPMPSGAPMTDAVVANGGVYEHR